MHQLVANAARAAPWSCNSGKHQRHVVWNLNHQEFVTPICCKNLRTFENMAHCMQHKLSMRISNANKHRKIGSEPDGHRSRLVAKHRNAYFKRRNAQINTNKTITTASCERTDACRRGNILDRTLRIRYDGCSRRLQEQDHGHCENQHWSRSTAQR